MDDLTEEQKLDSVISSDRSMYRVSKDKRAYLFASREESGWGRWKTTLESKLSEIKRTEGNDHHLVLYFSSHGLPGHFELQGKPDYLSYIEVAQEIFNGIKRHTLQKRLTLHVLLDACKSGSAIELFRSVAIAGEGDEPLGMDEGRVPFAFRFEILTGSSESVDAQGTVLLYALKELNANPLLTPDAGMQGDPSLTREFNLLSKGKFAQSSPQIWNTFLPYSSQGNLDGITHARP